MKQKHNNFVTLFKHYKVPLEFHSTCCCHHHRKPRGHLQTMSLPIIKHANGSAVRHHGRQCGRNTVPGLYRLDTFHPAHQRAISDIPVATSNIAYWSPPASQPEPRVDEGKWSCRRLNKKKRRRHKVNPNDPFFFFISSSSLWWLRRCHSL